MVLMGVEAADLEIVRSDARYVPPLTFPNFNESAQIRNEIRPIYIFNAIPEDFVLVAGFDTSGEVHAVTVQARAAVTHRWAILVTKNGYADVGFDDLLPSDDGRLNFAFGAKYAALSIADKDTYLSGGLRYEAPSGDIESGSIELQGGGDGFFDIFVTFESALWLRLGFQTSSGVHIAVDGDHDATSFHASLHFDYEMVKNLFGVIESNVLATLAEGDRTDSSLRGAASGPPLPWPAPPATRDRLCALGSWAPSPCSCSSAACKPQRPRCRTCSAAISTGWRRKVRCG